MPPLPSAPHVLSPSSAWEEVFQELLDSYSVNLVLSGGCGSYERLPAVGARTLFSVPGSDVSTR